MLPMEIMGNEEIVRKYGDATADRRESFVVESGCAGLIISTRRNRAEHTAEASGGRPRRAGRAKAERIRRGNACGGISQNLFNLKIL